MAYSSILGGDPAPTQPSGRGSDLLGPSDNSDSGSDAIGTQEVNGDSDAVGTGERGSVYGPDSVDGADIAPDRVVQLDASEDDGELGSAVDDGPGSGAGFPAADAEGQEMTDLDADSDGDGDGEADR